MASRDKNFCAVAEKKETKFDLDHQNLPVLLVVRVAVLLRHIVGVVSTLVPCEWICPLVQKVLDCSRMALVFVSINFARESVME